MNVQFVTEYELVTRSIAPPAELAELLSNRQFVIDASGLSMPPPIETSVVQELTVGYHQVGSGVIKSSPGGRHILHEHRVVHSKSLPELIDI